MLRTSIYSFFCLFVCVLTINTAAHAQIVVTLGEKPAQCSTDIIKLGVVAKVETTDRNLKRMIEALDIDMFEDEKTIAISKEQIRIRIELSGIERDQIEFSGPESITVAFKKQSSVRNDIQSTIGSQIASKFHIPEQDLEVVIDSSFNLSAFEGFDETAIRVTQNFSAEIPAGRQTITVTARHENGDSKSVRIPVSIAVVRELVVAVKGLSQKEVITASHVERIRRPVTNRNLRFASYEQVIGSAAQTDIRQYDVIKTNLIRKTNPVDATLVKRNTRVNIIAKRGKLSVVLKDAMALDNGVLGDRIAVKNPKTNERIIGTVVNATTVEIRY